MKPWCVSLMLLVVPSVGWAQFSFAPPGELVGGSGEGRPDDRVYAPGMRFPIEVAPAYANSQVWGVGGLHGPTGGECDARNYSFPWHDNYCESRSWTMPMCPAGVGHQGQDIRPSTCADDTHWAVAAADGSITSIGSYSVYLTATDGTRFDYLHMRSVAVTVGQRVVRGQRLGRVSDNFGTTSTTTHLHFNIRQSIAPYGYVYAPTYQSLIASYRTLIDAPPCQGVTEQCNGTDDDCDGLIDEGVANACGGCGTLPEERCNGRDDDCDGMVDEDQICDAEDVLFHAPAFDWGATSDVDGDGRADFCALGPDGVRCALARAPEQELLALPAPNATAWSALTVAGTLRTGDLDGDHRADVCIRSPEGVLCARSLGDRFAEPFLAAALTDAVGWNEVKYASSLRLTDVDGDGRDDLCVRAAAGFHCYHSTGTGFDPPIQTLTALSDAAGLDDVKYYGTLRMGDFNGDGRADLCVRLTDGMHCWPSTGTGFGAELRGPAWSDAQGWNLSRYWSSIQMADVNGDGRADLCARGSRGFRCVLSEGGQFGAEILSPGLADNTGWYDHDNYDTIRLGDLNGDGALELCGRANSAVFCWFWTGTQWELPVRGPELSDTNGWDEPQYYRTLRLADVNGDRRADLCARGVDGLRCYLSDGAHFPTSQEGPHWADDGDWDSLARYGSLRLAGPRCGPSASTCGAQPVCDAGRCEDSGTADVVNSDALLGDGAVNQDAGGGDAGRRLPPGPGCACRTEDPGDATTEGFLSGWLVGLSLLGLRARKRR